MISTELTTTGRALASWRAELARVDNRINDRLSKREALMIAGILGDSFAPGGRSEESADVFVNLTVPVLMAYPREIAERIADPLAGMPAETIVVAEPSWAYPVSGRWPKQRFRPTVGEIHAWCQTRLIAMKADQARLEGRIAQVGGVDPRPPAEVRAAQVADWRQQYLKAKTMAEAADRPEPSAEERKARELEPGGRRGDERIHAAIADMVGWEPVLNAPAAVVAELVERYRIGKLTRTEAMKALCPDALKRKPRKGGTPARRRRSVAAKVRRKQPVRK